MERCTGVLARDFPLVVLVVNRMRTPEYLVMNVAAYCIGVLNHLDCWKDLFRGKFNKRRKDLFC